MLCVCSRPPSKDRHHPRPVQALFWCQTVVLLQDEVQSSLRESRGQGLPVHLLKEKRCGRNLETAGVNWNALFFPQCLKYHRSKSFFFFRLVGTVFVPLPFQAGISPDRAPAHPQHAAQEAGLVERMHTSAPLLELT